MSVSLQVTNATRSDDSPAYYGVSSLMISGRLSFEEWTAVGDAIATVDKGLNWWIGDWVNYGERAFGEKYAQAVPATGRDKQTLANLAWVANAFEPSRRRDNLSFTHHAEVAALPVPVQERLLDLAEKRNWSVKALRKAAQELKLVSGGVPQIAPPAPMRNEPAAPPPATVVVEEEQEEDDGPDPLAEWERAEEELEAEREKTATLQRALEADDKGAEVLRLQKALEAERYRYSQLEGNVQYHLNENDRLSRVNKYQQNILDQLRRVLEVESNNEIMGALQDRLRA